MNQYSPKVAAIEMPKATARARLTNTAPPSVKGSATSQALADSGVRIDCGVEPNTISPPFDRINATPSVRMSCA